MGKTIIQIIAALKEMEVNILRDRTLKGLEAADARGLFGGRSKGPCDEVKATAAIGLYKANTSIDKILKILDISRQPFMCI